MLCCGVVYYAKQGEFRFESVDEILQFDNSNESCLKQYFLVVLFMQNKVILTFVFVDEILNGECRVVNACVLFITQNKVIPTFESVGYG